MRKGLTSRSCGCDRNARRLRSFLPHCREARGRKVGDVKTLMPRPRKNDPTALVRPLVSEYATAVARDAEARMLQRLRVAILGAIDGNATRRRRRVGGS